MGTADQPGLGELIDGQKGHPFEVADNGEPQPWQVLILG
jgi:hypothetical protein